jgi:hypothetical protein
MPPRPHLGWIPPRPHVIAEAAPWLDPAGLVPLRHHPMNEHLAARSVAQGPLVPVPLRHQTMDD